MAIRTNNPVTLPHGDALAVLQILGDYASSESAHASRTKSAAVAASCRSSAHKAKALAESIVRSLYTWSDDQPAGMYPRCDDPGAHRPGCLCDGGEPRL